MQAISILTAKLSAYQASPHNPKLYKLVNPMKIKLKANLLSSVEEDYPLLQVSHSAMMLLL
jgi:hypothetical protein